MSRLACLAAVALWCAAAANAQAQDRVYRCGPDGRSYSQEPCTNGRSVEVADTRSAEQAAQTRQAAVRDARAADELQRQRLQAERIAARQAPALIGPAKATRRDEQPCVKGAKCERTEARKARHGQSHTVTLYRPAGAR